MATRGASRTARWFLVLFALSLVAHVPVRVEYRTDPFSRTPISDALSYDQWGLEIAARGLASQPVFHQSPLFPVVLSWIDRATTPEARWGAAMIAGIALTSLAIALLVPVGELYLGSTAAGAVGGFL